MVLIMKSKKVEQNIALLSLLLILIPYGGEGYYKVSNLLIIILQFMLLFSLFGLQRMRFKLTYDYKLFSASFLILFFWQVFVNAYIALIVKLDFSYADLSEYVRTFQLLLPVLLVSSLLGANFKIERVVNILLLLATCHFLLMLLPKLMVSIDSIVELYGEGHYYTAGYARFRGFGIIGQPGKAGMFSVLLIIISLIHFRLFNSCKYRVAFIVVLSFIAIFMTLSRISLVLAFLSFFILVKGSKLKLLMIVICSFLLFVFVVQNEDLVKTLTRGLDVSAGKYSTASHRMVLKEWALDFIGQRIDTLLIGVGDTKDYISQFKHPFAFDLSLRTPDSSQTVWLVRYGLIGVIIGYMPLIFLGYRLLNSSLTALDKFTLIFVLFVMFIFSFVDPLYHDSKISIIISIYYIYFFCYLKKGSIREFKSNNCRT